MQRLAGGGGVGILRAFLWYLTTTSAKEPDIILNKIHIRVLRLETSDWSDGSLTPDGLRVLGGTVRI